MFGPPMPACELVRNAVARYDSQCGSGRASSSMYATISPVAACSPSLRALARPWFSVLISAEAVLLGDLVGAVGRAVVDDDHLVVGVVERAQPVEAAAQRVRAVVGADDDRDPGPVGVGAEGRLGEGLADRRERRLRRAVAVDEAEVPVVDVEAAAVPLVGPGEDEHARAAGGEGGAHLPVERARLGAFGVAQRVEADLGDEQRAVARDVLEPGQVRLELRARLEVDVEADEVEERQLEVLGGRVVDVGDERVRVLVLGRVVEALRGSARSAGGRASARSRPGSRCRSRSRGPRDGRRSPGSSPGRCARWRSPGPGRRGRRCAAPTACPTITHRPCSVGEVEQPARAARCKSAQS